MTTPTTAPAADQRRLLDVQAADTHLAQLAHRRRTLPEHAVLTDLAARDRAVRDRLVSARTLAGDLDREATRAEVDVEQVRSRAERTAARLASGTGTAKDLQALQREAEALTRRLGDLEDAQLDVMERQEAAGAAVTALQGEGRAVAEQGAAATASRNAALADLDAQVAAAQAERASAAAGLDPDLLALYDRVRAASSGLGAAALMAERCGGCRMQLSPSLLSAVRSAAPDAVVRCEECGRLIVRLPETEGHVHR